MSWNIRYVTIINNRNNFTEMFNAADKTTLNVILAQWQFALTRIIMQTPMNYRFFLDKVSFKFPMRKLLAKVIPDISPLWEIQCTHQMFRDALFTKQQRIKATSWRNNTNTSIKGIIKWTIEKYIVNIETIISLKNEKSIVVSKNKPFPLYF